MRHIQAKSGNTNGSWAKAFGNCKALWLLPILLLAIYTIMGRERIDVFSATYNSTAFSVRYNSDYFGDDTQPLAFSEQSGDSVGVYTLRDGALSLQKGTYDLAFSYAGAQDTTVLKVYSSDYISEDNSGGKILFQAVLSPEEYFCKGVIELDQDVNSVYVMVETRAEGFEVDYFRLESWGTLYNDRVFYCVVLALLVFAVIWVSNTKAAWVRQSCWNKATFSGAGVFRVSVFVCAAAVLVASLPILQPSLYTGHDLPFHMARIEGLASALRSGQLPARVHGETLNGFGYANSYFYPELLLYIPAILRLLGVSTVVCYKLYLVMIHALTAAVSYYSFEKLFQSRMLGLALAVVYVLNPYRLICCYYRSAVGEYTAITFLPLVVYGLYAVLKGNKKDWPALVWGATGLIQSHILSTEIAAFACLLIVLPFVVRLFKGERRILELLYACVYTVALNAWFILPMLAMIVVTHPAVFGRTQYPFGFTKYQLGYLFATFSATNIGPHTIGWVILLAIGGYGVYRLLSGSKAGGSPFVQLGDAATAFVIIGAVATTAFFPWDLIATIPILGKLLDTIQFPYRIMSLVGVAGAVLVGCVVLLCAKKKEHRMVLAAAFCCVAIIHGSVFMESIFPQGSGYADKNYYASNMNNSLSVGQYEYLPSLADIGDIVDSCPVIRSENQSLRIDGYRHEGTTMEFHYTMEPGDANMIVLPITYLPKYSILVNGEPVEAEITELARVQFEAPASEGTVSVRYREPWIFRLCELGSAAALVVFLCRKKLWKSVENRIPQSVKKLLQE